MIGYDSAFIGGTVINYDRSTRVIQDLNRKVALIRIGGTDPKTLDSAIEGNETDMNRVLISQRSIAERLYGNHKGMTVILASGGTRQFDNNNLPGMQDSPDEIPNNPEKYVNPKFIYRA